jgi:hypothetical protein
MLDNYYSLVVIITPQNCVGKEKSIVGQIIIQTCKSNE